MFTEVAMHTALNKRFENKLSPVLEKDITYIGLEKLNFVEKLFVEKDIYKFQPTFTLTL